MRARGVGRNPGVRIDLVPHALRPLFLKQGRLAPVVAIGGMEGREGIHGVLAAPTPMQDQTACMHTMGRGPFEEGGEAGDGRGPGWPVEFPGALADGGVMAERNEPGVCFFGSRTGTSPGEGTGVHELGEAGRESVRRFGDPDAVALSRGEFLRWMVGDCGQTGVGE